MKPETEILPDGFKMTELGPLPEEWQVVRLGEVAQDIKYGYTASAESHPVGPKMLRVTDIRDGIVDWSKVPYCRCDGAALLEKYALAKGDLVIARTGSVGNASLIRELPEKALFASYLIRIRVLPSILLPEFLGFFAQSNAYRLQIERFVHGAVQPNINATQLRTLLIPLPEQQEIARILQAVDEKIAAEERRKGALEALFQTLLHHLMTGKVRVAPELTEAKA